MLNRLIDSYFVATSQKHFYIVEYGEVLVYRRLNCHHYYTEIPIVRLLFITSKYSLIFK